MPMPRLAAVLPAFALTGLLAACLPSFSPQEEAVPSGAEDFAAYCAACHGMGGKGDGPMAATLPKRPADLTTLSARNGGTFPTTRVMAKIWGYSGGGQNGAVMPDFAPLLEGAQMVLYDGGDGIPTPTPLRLVQVAEHLKTFQQ
jgi:mono/diheme cytochrome c family protein